MILIIGAMDEEVAALTRRMSDPLQEVFCNITITKGRLGSKQVVVSKSGAGKVNAAYTASVLVQHFNPELLINIGSAGALQEDIKMGDIVIATELRYHDFYIGEKTYTDERFIFRPMESLLNLAKSVAQADTHYGLIVSGDQFVTKDSYAYANIQKYYGWALAAEMESAAIAAVCQNTATPYLIIRSISDNIGHDDNAVTFEEYLALASENSAELCAMLVEKL